MKTRIAVVLALLAAAVAMLFSPYALAAVDCTSNTLTASQAVQCGANSATNSNQTPDQATQNLNDTTSSLIDVLSIAVAVIAVIMLIVAGLRFVISSGNQENVASARRSIVYAVIGLVVAAVAQLIVHFVLGKTTSVLK